MKSKYYQLLIMSILAITTIGCNPQSKDLKVTLKQNNLCVFTDNPKTKYGFENSILISTGKVDYSKEFASNYEQLYKNGVLPIDESTCIKIPVNVLERNVVYKITLETNKIYHADVCVIDKENHVEVKHIEAGKSTCE